MYARVCLFLTSALCMLSLAHSATQFSVPGQSVIVCTDTLDNVCVAPTNCNRNGQVTFSAGKSLNLEDAQQRNGEWIVRGGWTLIFPASCDVVCQGECSCEDCTAAIDVPDIASGASSSLSSFTYAVSFSGLLFVVMAALFA